MLTQSAACARKTVLGGLRSKEARCAVKPNNFLATIDASIAGIPCQIGVTHFHVQPPHRGGAHTCESDWDFYGYTEIDFQVLDRKGYPADWLAKKMTDRDNDRINEDITNHMKDD